MAYVPRGKIVVSVVDPKTGKGVFEEDKQVEIETLAGGATLRRVAGVNSVPVTDIYVDSTHLVGAIANERGCNFLECEMQPGQLSPMHATPSIDFGTMITGEITLILDSGEERVLKPGDMYIQKSAAHAWENRGTTPARFATVAIASRPEK
ncbi:hypothetical protein CAC42_4769 [Sphaceloma murrayae]|uniref:Cupin type-2 domain-containing protein n=1 Tax=Sphaceloma murrayae TaxID=2082308 RepID=A0A2K1QNW7_9PEZI|nr:hypothetical protein CAC42_4769 [Sphaceloma murrayae]